MPPGGSRKLTIEIAGIDTGGSKVLQAVAGEAGKTATAAESSSKRIGSAFGTVFSQLGQSGLLGPFSAQIDTAQRALDGLADKGASTGKKLLGAGGGGLAAGGALTALASGDIQAQNQLKAAIDTTGGAYDDYADRIDAAAKKQVEFGHTDEEVNGALATLTLSYGDTGKALDQMQLVADIAAQKHISLGAAAEMVAKVHGGSTRILKEYGIEVGTNADGTKNYDGALADLSGKLTGQASAAADSFGGKLRSLKAEVENQVSAFGQKYGPAIMAAGAATSTVGAITEGASAILGRFRTAKEAATVATEALTVAESEEAVAQGLALGPILLIIAAVAALAVGAYLLYENWDTVWEGIKTGASATKDWIVGVFDDVLGFITGLPGRIADAAHGMWDGILAAFKSVINAVIGAWNNLGIPSFHIHITMPLAIPNIDFDTPSLSFPDIPYLASGGLFDRPTVAMVAEAGQKEIVSPESLMRTIVRDESSGAIHVHFHGPVARDSESWIVSVIEKAGRSGKKLGPGGRKLVTT